jgi:CheY-like chemotaxis protein
VTSAEPRESAPPLPRLLVVDDDASVLMTYRLILEQNGFRVTPAPSIGEAMAALQGEPFDAVLCDLTLEAARSGFDVVAAARRLPHPPACLMLTGYATPELVERAQRAQLPLLFKPIRVEELLGALHRALAARTPSP